MPVVCSFSSGGADLKLLVVFQDVFLDFMAVDQGAADAFEVGKQEFVVHPT